MACSLKRTGRSRNKLQQLQFRKRNWPACSCQLNSEGKQAYKITSLYKTWIRYLDKAKKKGAWFIQAPFFFIWCLLVVKRNLTRLKFASLFAATRHHRFVALLCTTKPPGKACQKPDRLFRYRHHRKFAPKKEPLYLFVALDRTSKFAYAELHSDRTLRPGVIQALLLRNALEVKKALTSLSDGLQLRRTN